MASSLFGRDALHPRNSIDIPRGGKVVSAILEILTISVLTICLSESQTSPNAIQLYRKVLIHLR